MATRDAIRIAKDDGLDLVEISPTARPPVCRILDFGRFQYEEAKTAKKTKKKQQQTQLKEMRFRPKIDEHDINFKTNRLREFLIEGHKVRAYVEFRGREMTHTEFGQKILTRIRAQLEDVGQPEPGVRMEGRHMSMIINPKKALPKPKSEDSKGKSGPKPKKEDVASPKEPAPAPAPEPVAQGAEKQDVTVGSGVDQPSGGASSGD
jgi:translation initiation factor IF-3